MTRSFTHLSLALAALFIASSAAHAATVIYQNDFTPDGLGGVTAGYGSTDAPTLYSENGTTTSAVASSLFGTGSALQVTVPSSSTGYNARGGVYLPISGGSGSAYAANDNPFQPWFSDNGNASDPGRYQLNGAMDFYYRTNVTAGMLANPGRIYYNVDSFFRTENGSGSAGLGYIYFQQESRDGQDFSFRRILPGGTSTSYAPNATLYQADTVYHIGYTFSTDASGLVTVNFFVQEGTDAIDTTATPTESLSFTLDSTQNMLGFLGGNVFRFGSTGGARIYDPDGAYTSVTSEYGRLTIWEGVPDQLTGVIPEPASFALLAMGSMLCMARRRSK